MAHEQRASTDMMAVANAMIRLHKEQFGRGPTKGRAHFAGSDTLICTLENVLLPAEHHLIELGEPGRVRDTRVAFQVATKHLFIAAVEQIVYREVRAFASGIDVEADVVFEIFQLEPRGSEEDEDMPVLDPTDQAVA
jgi:uncharacterized protein YbcI